MGQSSAKSRFVICIPNEGNEDIVAGKVYQVLEDEKAAQVGYIRVIDESGKDYLYPADYFVSITLPQAAERALFTSSSEELLEG
jgi:hypothetical protein